MMTQLGLRDNLTHRGNLQDTRYGWLRLTPAYSVHLVSEILEKYPDASSVLDPFCGTGTTALVCAERGIACDTVDINPFLVWLAHTKTRKFDADNTAELHNAADKVAVAIGSDTTATWTPPLHQIEKWWDEATLRMLSRMADAIRKYAGDDCTPVSDLLRIAFCRCLIVHSNVSFGHQSMSFKKNGHANGNGTLPGILGPADALQATWEKTVSSISNAALSPIALGPEVLQGDARNLATVLGSRKYSLVVTSPPYPNRMSYIRELRPYMYWLGYLRDGRDAGELDWQAIGGTWGCATSNLTRWKPNPSVPVPHEGFDEILRSIRSRSPVLSTYVQKYFEDMVQHIQQLYGVVSPGGSVHYIVGNSKFYDVMLPVEEIYRSLLQSAGFDRCTIRTIRKRTSKKELFEFVVSAVKA